MSGHATRQVLVARTLASLVAGALLLAGCGAPPQANPPPVAPTATPPPAAPLATSPPAPAARTPPARPAGPRGRAPDTVVPDAAGPGSAVPDTAVPDLTPGAASSRATVSPLPSRPPLYGLPPPVFSQGPIGAVPNPGPVTGYGPGGMGIVPGSPANPPYH